MSILRPYAVYRNGLLWRRRQTQHFAQKDVLGLQAQGFKAWFVREG